MRTRRHKGEAPPSLITHQKNAVVPSFASTPRAPPRVFRVDPIGRHPKKTSRGDRIGCFAFALALVASAFTVEAWSPPYQTQRLYYVLGSGLRSNSTMSLDGVGAFTIRFTGLKFDWNYRDYGQLFRMKTQGGSDDLMIGFTGDAYVAAKRNKLIARLTPGKDVFGSEALPDWQHPDTKGLDVVVAFNGTSGRITFYVDGSVHGVSEPQGAVPFSLPNFTSGPFSGNRDQTNTNNAYYGLNGYQETVTVWAGVALDRRRARGAPGRLRERPNPEPPLLILRGWELYHGAGRVVRASQTDVVIADHITGDSAHALKWSGRFEQFREVPAESAANAEVCCAANLRKFGFTITARASNGIFRDTVDSLDAESVDEGRRCHAAA